MYTLRCKDCGRVVGYAFEKPTIDIFCQHFGAMCKMLGEFCGIKFVVDETLEDNTIIISQFNDRCDRAVLSLHNFLNELRGFNTDMEAFTKP